MLFWVFVWLPGWVTEASVILIDQPLLGRFTKVPCFLCLWKMALAVVYWPPKASQMLFNPLQTNRCQDIVIFSWISLNWKHDVRSFSLINIVRFYLSDLLFLQVWQSLGLGMGHKTGTKWRKWQLDHDLMQCVVQKITLNVQLLQQVLKFSGKFSSKHLQISFREKSETKWSKMKQICEH